MNQSIAPAPPPLDAAVIENVLLQGDLSKLTAPQRLAYYNSVCESLGLNPLTKPFEYLHLSGRLILYARRDATDQLRRLHGVSILAIDSREVGGVFIVTAKAQDARQRIDVSTGAVSIANLKGEAMANALMKAETKAKRRVTLSICGLGLLDETEVDTIAADDAPPLGRQRKKTTPAIDVPAADAPTDPAPAAGPLPPGVYVASLEKDDQSGVWDVILSTGLACTTTSKKLVARADAALRYQQPVTATVGDDGVLTNLVVDGPAGTDVLPI